MRALRTVHGTKYSIGTGADLMCTYINTLSTKFWEIGTAKECRRWEERDEFWAFIGNTDSFHLKHEIIQIWWWGCSRWVDFLWTMSHNIHTKNFWGHYWFRLVENVSENLWTERNFSYMMVFFLNPISCANNWGRDLIFFALFVIIRISTFKKSAFDFQISLSAKVPSCIITVMNGNLLKKKTVSTFYVCLILMAFKKMPMGRTYDFISFTCTEWR